MKFNLSRVCIRRSAPFPPVKLRLVLPRDGIPVAGGLLLLRRCARARARAAHCQRQKRDGTNKIESGEYMFHGCSLFWLVVWSGFDFASY
jgi:hypothetical protein